MSRRCRLAWTLFTKDQHSPDCDVMSHSKKVLLVILQNNVMCFRCNFEAQVAHYMFQEQGRLNNLIVVLPSSIPSAYLNKTLRYILKTRTYIEWKSDSPQFWKRLRATIETPGNPLLIVSLTNTVGGFEYRTVEMRNQKKKNSNVFWGCLDLVQRGWCAYKLAFTSGQTERLKQFWQYLD